MALAIGIMHHGADRQANLNKGFRSPPPHPLKAAGACETTYRGYLDSVLRFEAVVLDSLVSGNKFKKLKTTKNPCKERRTTVACRTALC